MRPRACWLCGLVGAAAVPPRPRLSGSAPGGNPHAARRAAAKHRTPPEPHSRHQRRVRAMALGVVPTSTKIIPRHCRAEEGQKLSQIADTPAWYLAASRVESNDRRRHCQRSAPAHGTPSPSSLSAKAWLLKPALLKKLNTPEGARICASCTRSAAARADMTLADATRPQRPGSCRGILPARLLSIPHRDAATRAGPLCWPPKYHGDALFAAASRLNVCGRPIA